MYVVDALMEEDDEGEDAVALTEEQKGFPLPPGQNRD